MNAPPLRVWAQSPERFFQTGFMQIANTRMRGLPIVNPRLQVRVLGFERFDGQWLGAVVTPWSILIVLVCGDRSRWVPLRATEVRSVALPSGEYEFIGMNDPLLGTYQACRLMSPLTHIPDQRSAEAIALEALRLMRQPKRFEVKEEVGIALKPDPYLGDEQASDARSRRQFLKRSRS